jgi:hypothetical protein
MAVSVKPPPRFPTVGAVVEQRQGGRAYLVVQETPDRASKIESWMDAFDVGNRLLGRIKDMVDGINTAMDKSNQRLSSGLRRTGAKIAANQRLLDEIVKGRS